MIVGKQAARKWASFTKGSMVLTSLEASNGFLRIASQPARLASPRRTARAAGGEDHAYVLKRGSLFTYRQRSKPDCRQEDVRQDQIRIDIGQAQQRGSPSVRLTTS